MRRILYDGADHEQGLKYVIRLLCEGRTQHRVRISGLVLVHIVSYNLHRF